ncbi:mandelate racemase/muconate lactonizing enzyme family protein [Paraburkholderia phenoliruptrix]|uniref:Racemase n=2 Tax=Paraburkholderia phenoliruptrix TaxID=252970 RepID=K0DMG7_9BURK|nr:mandelate racemase/muconate lactonizing enzyme family protein [Paraburkholderia phenoliruptrix]AFT86095.1 racemase [Paraburkholderia phenoliruptrix BR3459a]CAB4048637.1 D-galactarolactone cycloisomerase [Paraburkholderia phenoliruptrix]
MKIRSVETRVVEIPFEDGGKGLGITPSIWKSMETVLIRIEDTDGNVGWGEAFGYFVADATRSVVETRLKPLLEGATVESIPAWTKATQRALHIFGRYGITLFAISGVDMALWDLAAKRQREPLWKLLGGTAPAPLPTYASLVRYGDGEAASSICRRALDEGFTDIKLHEIELAVIEAAHATVDGRAPISVDVNCAWTDAQSLANIETLKALRGISWLEEPIFPPEDFARLAALRDRGVPIAAGENWCTALQFQQAVDARAIDYLQPSLSKVGGVTEFLEIVELARAAQLGVLPHSPYFGPGFLTTLHLATAHRDMLQIEWLYVEPAAELIALDSIRAGHQLRLGDAPGIGLAPDEAVIARFVRPR